MNEKNEVLRYRIVYSGRVQGVGFRWQVMNVSESYEVTGFVRNLSDGTVELLVEGTKTEAREMIDAVEAKLKDYWSSKVEDLREGFPHFDRFSIDGL
jgi:acylphosphatase